MSGRPARNCPTFFRQPELVEYRIKVTHLWAEYKDISAVRAEHV
jgi:hypothetical protein